MRIQSTTSYAAFAVLVGALACAGNKARTDEGTQPNERAAARDTTTTQAAGRDTTGRDTLNGQVQNPPGYRGMERDTTLVPPTQQTPSDTFLQNQGQGRAQDTAGYSGAERDTTGQRAQPSPTDTTGYGRDTSGMHHDSTQVNPSSSNPSGLDSTGQSRTGDTTGYSPSQQSQDSTAR
jgi:hypothetical protein